MKKFLTISMMALAVVLASSCNKNEDPEVSDNTKYINTWVAENVAVSDVLADIDGTSIDELLNTLPVSETIKNQIAAMKVNVIVKFDENGKGNTGLLIDNQILLLLNGLITYAAQEGIEIPEAIKTLVGNLKVNDYIGATFTYTAAPEDATKGKLEFTVVADGKTEKSEVDYSGLSDDSMTISYTDEVTIKYTFKSLGSTKLTVNNFIDVVALAALLPDTGDDEE